MYAGTYKRRNILEILFLKLPIGIFLIFFLVFAVVLFIQYNNKQQESLRRNAIAAVYPEFTTDYENRLCFAGCSVERVKVAQNYYYAFIAHGSGLPIVSATCLYVDANLHVELVGNFSQRESDNVYHTIDPITCSGLVVPSDD